MAGIEHCVSYRCLMNGSANLAESERRPRRLCPIDLQKLEWFIGCDLAKRNACLERFWRDLGDSGRGRLVRRGGARIRPSAGSGSPALVGRRV